jgi:thiol-disulfide isomerase/thioredoxin
MYRLLFSQQNDGFVDFIYNGENISLNFNPDNPLESVQFLNSEENSTYQNYLTEYENSQQIIDSLQVSFFTLNDKPQKKRTSNIYNNEFKNLTKIQKKYQKATKDLLANHFIKANRKYYSEKLLETPQEYLNSEKEHYFDYIDFTDKVLYNSTLLSEKVVDYVFYLNGSDDVAMQNGLYKASLNEVINRLGDDLNLQSEMLSLLLHSFSQIENTVLIDYVINTYYLKLPSDLQNNTFLNQIKEKVRLAIGKQAPEITWEENGVQKKLSELSIAKNYILVFWSSGCSHCLAEIPKLYDFTKDKEQLHVIAYALEKDDIGFNKYTPKYKEWTNILGLQKWQNPMVNTYKVNATPTYFILDKDKKIIAKPDYFRDVKAFFED